MTVSAESDLEAGLAAIGSKITVGASGISDLRRMTAGATQEVWRFELLEGQARTPLILRRAPGGTRVSDTAVGLETEAELIRAADRVGAPVPPVRYVLEPDDGLGHGFIMGFVEGETLGGRIARGEAFAAVRPKLARQCGEILARIHTLDPDAFPRLRRSTPAELVAQYKATYQATGWPRPVFDLAFRWLDAHCPPDPKAMKLVHGDFRNGNLMIGPHDGRPRGARLGDRPRRRSDGGSGLDLHRLLAFRRAGQAGWRFRRARGSLGRLRSRRRRAGRPRARAVLGGVRLHALGRDVRLR